MAEQQGNRDPNRIDVSLNMVSDTGLQAVERLTAQLSALYGFVRAQSEDAAGRAAGMANVASRLAHTQQGTGVSHAMSPDAATWLQSQEGQFYYPGGMAQTGQPGPSTNPSINANTQNARREAAQAAAQAARDNFFAYRRFVEGRADEPPEGGLTQAGAQYAGHIDDYSLLKFARREVKGGHLQEGQESGRYSSNPLVAALDRFFELRHPAQVSEDRTYEYVTGEDPSGGGRRGGPRVPTGGIPPAPPGGGGTAGPPGGTPPPEGTPDDGDPNAPSWYRSLQRAGINPDDRPAFTIPRMGEFTWQDRMGMAAEYLGARAMSRYDEDIAEGREPTQGITGRAANYAQYARENAAAFTLAHRDYRRLRDFSRRVEAGGEAQGFSRHGEGLLGGDINILGMGVRSPFAGTLGAGLEWGINQLWPFGDVHMASEASREALRQEVTRRRVAMAPGVSSSEAEAIQNQTAALGYSGDLNESLQMDVFRRLQQQGIGPDVAAPLVDQAIRQGNNNLKDVRDTIEDLGNAARAAHMTLQDATRSTEEYTNAMAQMGGRVGQSQRSAAGFIRSGVDPTIISGAMQNPFVQGAGVAMTGIPGMFQGTLNQSGQAAIVARSLDQALQISRPLAARGDQFMTLPNGERVRIGRARDQQLAMASHLTGINQEFIARYQRNPRILTQAPMATQLLQEFGGEVQRLSHSPAEPQGRAAHVGRDQHFEAARRNMHPVRDRRLDQIAGDAVVNGRLEWGEIEQQLLALDPTDRGWQRRVRDLRHVNIENRVGRANQMISKLTQTRPQDAPDNLIGLTDEARKFFKITGNRNKDRNAPRSRANAGGPGINSAYSGANFPSQEMNPITVGTPGG
jgi:hypothetical protein